ncbi:MAG: hypothetical protein KDK63_00725, partial [Chlamydiia bacterium]|nr:hypothetical protein [Chlamydiia bacterium]
EKIFMESFLTDVWKGQEENNLNIDSVINEDVESYGTLLKERKGTYIDGKLVILTDEIRDRLIKERRKKLQSTPLEVITTKDSKKQSAYHLELAEQLLAKKTALTEELYELQEQLENKS